MSTDGQETERSGSGNEKGGSTERKEKDAWDKAEIISAFLSSVVVAGVGVVIAGVGLRVNASIQEAQIESSRRNTEAQAAVARQIADGQRQVSALGTPMQLIKAFGDRQGFEHAVHELQSALYQETA